MKKVLFACILFSFAIFPVQSEVIYGVSSVFGLGDGTSVEGRIADVAPAPLALSTYPNPFNPSVSITLSGLRFRERAVLEVFDATGAVVHRARLSTPVYVWNSASGSRQVGSGLYVVRITCRNQVLSKKILLLK